MILRHLILGVATTLLLSSSPATIVLAQSADEQEAPQRRKRPPAAEAPGDAGEAQAPRRRPAAEAQGGDDAPARPRRRPAAEAQDGGDEAPARPRRRPAAESQDGGEAPAPRTRPRAGQAEQPDATPGEGRPKRPRPGQAEQPDATQPATPGEGRPKRPRPGQAEQPDATQPATPGEGRPKRPRPGQAEQPDTTQPATPGEGRPKRPRPGQAEQPDTTQPATPGEGRPQRPRPGQAEQPDTTQPATPGEGRPQRPRPGQSGGFDPMPGTGEGRPMRPRPAPVTDNPAPAVNPTPPLESTRTDPGAERSARQALGDNRQASQLDDATLRRRLDTWRNALALGNLSPETSRTLRQRLAQDRSALRDRVYTEETSPNRPRRPGREVFDETDGRRPYRVRPPRGEDVIVLQRDRRPGRDLDEVTLNRRIYAYRDAMNDQRYSEAERRYYADAVEADRREMRRRREDDRRRRIDRMRGARQGATTVIVLDGEPPRGPMRPTVFAAEVDDEVLEEQLVSRPLRPLPRRYSRAEVMAEPETIIEQPSVRQAIPGVELDTIRFGFNEAFVREEELSNLDRVGQLIERIVAKHPNELFMIEGHTDAVGSDEANLILSKKRAEAIKEALVQYYGIRPENLVTAGLGKRYLKVPTPEEEQENRRVTIRRITSLVAEN